MQFGMTNTATNIQGNINNQIREVLDNFATAYFDNVIICGCSEEDRVEYVEWVLQCNLEAGLNLKIEQCELNKEMVKYLG